MKLKDELKELLVFLLIALLIVLAFSFVLFGVTGLRVVLGITLVLLPFYIILNNFELSYGEKFVFSAVLGFTIFPSLVYILGLIIPFRIAIVITFIVFFSIAILLRRYKLKNTFN